MQQDTSTIKTPNATYDKMTVSPLFPHAALVLYSRPYGPEDCEVFPAMHLMKGIPGRSNFGFGEAMPLTAENCAKFMSVLEQRSRVSSDGDTVATQFELRKPIPPNMLFAYDEDATVVCCWWEPSKRRVISHRMNEKREEDSFTATTPHMLFLVYGDTLYVYAMKKQPKRDEDGTLSFQLCNAPFWNVSGDGRVCLGTAKISMTEKVDFTWIMQEYSRAFWGSYFTAEHGIPRPKRWRGTLIQFWNLMEKRSGIKGYPSILLIPLSDSRVPKVLKPFNQL